MSTLHRPRDHRKVIDLFYYHLGQQVKLFLGANHIPLRQLAADLDTPLPELDDLLNGAVNDEELGMVLIHLNNRRGLDINSLWKRTAGTRATPGPVTSK